MHFELVFVILFSVATAVAVAARRLKIPYTVALVVAGLILGTAHAFEPPHLTKELLFAVILPGLIFEAAFHLEQHDFLKDKLAISALAIPGVVVAIALTAVILLPIANALDFIQGFTFIHALVFSAVIVATDPISVVALFKSVGVPRRLAVLVEGESLLNDGTGVVLFTVVLSVANGAAFSVGGASLEFLKVAGMGALIGGAIGYLASQLIHRIDDAMVELTLTMIAAYGAFVVAEQLHYSGVIATVVAGMLCGNYAARTGMSPSTRIAVETFWEYLAFALNSVIFLLIGLEVNFDSLLATWKLILAAYVAVMLARALVVYGVAALLRPTSNRIPWSWAAVLTWSGLRGGISMVLALSLPATFPHREVIVNMTFGVVLISILVQGLSMKPLLRRLGVVSGWVQVREDYELNQARLRTAQAALAEMARIRQEGSHNVAVLDRLSAEYVDGARSAETALSSLMAKESGLAAEELAATRRRLLTTEKTALFDCYRTGIIGEECLHRMITAVDHRLAGLDADEAARPSSPPPTQTKGPAVPA